LSVYFIAQIEMKDPEVYQKYLDKAGEVFSKYNGEYLAVDDSPVILEGEWDYTRVVLIRFPSEEELKRWYMSEEYQELLQFRLKGAKCDTLMVKGK